MKYITGIILCLFVVLSENSNALGEYSLIRENHAPIDTFAINNDHSYIGFTIKFMGISKVKGQFTDVDAVLIYDGKDITKAEVDVKIKVESVLTGNATRDKDLMSTGFFNKRKYPEITFKSARIEKIADGFICHGTFSMKGVTKNISIPFTVNEDLPRTHRGTNGSITLNRMDYGITASSNFFQTGDMFVSEDVAIELDMLWINKNFKRKRVTKILGETITNEGIEAAIRKYYFLKENNAEEYGFSEEGIQRLATNLIKEKKYEEAIEIYKLIVKEYPKSFTAFYLMGRTYERIDNVKGAIKSYEITLLLNPFHTLAKRRLDRLKDR